MSKGNESSSSFKQIMANLRPAFGIEKLVSQVFDDMGLGPVEASVHTADTPRVVDFSVLHFVILPQKSAWIDFLLEAGRPSAQALYKAFSGVPEQSDDDLEDVLRETMNMIHGVLKVAFKEDGADVIIPVVPQSVASDRLVHTPGGYSLHSCHLFNLPGIALRLTMVARIAPVSYKQLSDLSLATVLAEPLSPDGSNDLILLKKGTMLNKRVLQKVRSMADFGEDERKHAVIEPSPYAKLVTND